MPKSNKSSKPNNKQTKLQKRSSLSNKSASASSRFTIIRKQHSGQGASTLSTVKELAKRGLSSIWSYAKEAGISIPTPLGPLKLGGSGSSSIVEQPISHISMPAANGMVSRSFYKVGKLPGRQGDGIRVMGHQYLSECYTGAGDQLAFAGVGSYPLSPDAIGGNMALDARNYTKFRFQFFALHYVASCATSNTARVLMSYIPDAALGSYAGPSFETLQSTKENVVTTEYISTDLYFDMRPSATGANQTFYCEYDSTTPSTTRQTAQGLMLARKSAISTTAVGEFKITYVLDLFERIVDLGFTVQLKPRPGETDLELLEAVIKSFPDNISERDLRRCIQMRRTILERIKPSVDTEKQNLIIEFNGQSSELIKHRRRSSEKILLEDDYVSPPNLKGDSKEEKTSLVQVRSSSKPK